MTARRLAASAGFLGVALGAFGAHTFKDSFTPEQAAWWQTATTYLLLHAAAMLGTARADGGASGATWSFVAGVLVFSGSLYAMALGAPRWFGAITPLGGLALLAGWALLLKPAAGPRPA